MNSTINIKDLLERGRAEYARQGREQEIKKVGTLRAGNSGLVALDGQIVSKCARMTYLRMIGIDADMVDSSKAGMFEGGRSNEDSWVELIKLAKEPGLIIKRESEIPISWKTDNGITVTGRPDIVLCNESGPIKGLELKQVSSLWTARDVGLSIEPKMPNLLQAAHYSWQVGVPFELWYTSRVNFAAVSQIGKVRINWPRKEDYTGDSSRVKFNSGGFLKDILPFEQGFELQWTEGGQLKYRPIGDGPWKYTIITVDGIKKYYNLVASLKDNKELPAPPTNLNPDGTKGKFSLSAYCPLGDLCCSNDNANGITSLDDWALKVLKFLDNRPIDKV